ncbi:branched-chain amino acid ABC transporter permease [Paradesulfitobacterium aromaticivorans]
MLQQLVINGLFSGGVYALLAMGFNLIWSTTKVFDIGFGALYIIGAYTMYLFTMEFHFSFWISLLVAIPIVFVFAYLCYSLLYLPLIKKGASEFVLIAISLGVLSLMQNLIQLAIHSEAKFVQASAVFTAVWKLGGATITGTQIVAVVLSLVALITLTIILKSTSVGLKIKAIEDEPISAAFIGISVSKTRVIAYFFGSILAVLASSITVSYTGLYPGMGMMEVLMAAIAVQVGGIGSLFGSFVGGIFLGLVQNLGIWKLPSEWQNAIAFLVLTLFLLFRPRGLFGKKIFKMEV